MTVTLTDKKHDFSGYATRVGIKCSDGRTIMGGAFAHQDRQKVPLVWSHEHHDPEKVLGYAILEHRDDGVYAYAFFNDTPKGQVAKQLVMHGDVEALSIFAKNLKQQGLNVLHGDIKEVSLVMAGANPGAYIDNVNLQHSDDEDALIGEAIIYSDGGISIAHADDDEGDDDVADENTDADNQTAKEVLDSLTEKQRGVVYTILASALAGDGDDSEGEDVEHADSDDESDESVQDVWNSLTDTQKDVIHGLIGAALESEDDDDEDDEVEHSDSDSDSDSDSNSEEDSDSDNDENSESNDDSDSDNEADLQHSDQEGTNMPRNVFEQNGNTDSRPTLSHSDLQTISRNAVKDGSFKEAFEDFIEHADYGIQDIEYLFPDAKALTNQPELIARQAEWVPKVLGATKHSPFAKIKSIVADLTADEARAKGYVKGTMKKEEVIKLLRRTTSPTTVYKKQKLDRDDIIDITDLDVVAWLKWEIRFMLNEEIARAILIGDGRSSLDEDKIKDPEGANDGIGIRSIANDHEMYAHRVQLAANVSNDVLIDEITRSRTAYRGSGSPTFYTTDKVLTDLLLLKDKMGRRLYETEAALASAIRVKEIVSVEVLEEVPTVLGILVNLTDYTVGANKGGELSFFEDFDIDFNQNKYLMETRISGALTKPKSAIVIKRNQGISATPVAPTFNTSTNTITIPTTTGIDYLIDGVVVTGTKVIAADTQVDAEAKDGYYIPAGATTSWTFTYTAGA